jgi:transcriptional antiterminator
VRTAGWDRDRLKVLSKAKKGLLTQKQAAQHLDVTERQIRRMLTRMPEAAKQQALSLLSTKEYAEF